MSNMVERVARIIANAMGDNFSDAFKNKERWTAKRGMSGGRFRDVNEPMQCDYLAAAQAAIAAMQADTDLDRIKRERDQAVEALRGIKSEAERENGSWVHLKRCIAAQARQTLASIEGTGHE